MKATESKHYDCKSCVNQASPLCELCTQVTSPGGKEHKPKYYIGISDVRSPAPDLRIPYGMNRDLESKALAIARYIGNGLPVPVKLVMEYNALIEREND